ncbi:phage portal protein [Mesorhizobium sp. B2-3-4]|uniref:phage portal protein n=1 Tax=Mesorhizobium sp. B2-3-4 TaxID=2589959 RepID=UPI001128367B|nr:phage portal protein [Mesorhizobium sp. B2-3-4]TPM41550.1 phage portal protein [Mesorhizobium sp. B2-3-4]
MANALTLLSRAFIPQARVAKEGEYRPGPYALSNGWLSASAGRFLNWWQMGYSLNPYGQSSAMVEACISAYAQTVAMCPGDHWVTLANGGRERVVTSALTRILRKPNDYQSISDLLLNLTRRLYDKGEAFAVAIRNNRGEPGELHMMRDGRPLLANDGSIFYSLAGNEIVEQRFDLSDPIPARDVMHIRLHTPRHPLKGESPILATVLERAMAGAALNQQVAFYVNQARPSFMLETDEKLTPQQVKDLRDRWNEQTQGDNAGGTPILSWGLKAKPVSISAADAEIANMLKITDQSIALAFRMPLAVLGIGDTPFASTEALMSSWKSSGLGFCLNHIEEAFGLLFGLKGQPDEYVEFDTSALMRSNFKERMEGWAIATKSGIGINEFRNAEGYASVAHGDEPRVQQQVVPLSYGAKMQPPDPNKAALAPPAPDREENNEEAGRTYDDHIRDIDARIAALLH